MTEIKNADLHASRARDAVGGGRREYRAGTGAGLGKAAATARAMARRRSCRFSTQLLWGLWPLAALLAGAAGVFAALPTLAVLGVAAVLLLALLAPRTTAGLVVLSVLFARPLDHLLPGASILYGVDGLVVLCVLTMPLRRLATRRPLRTFPGQWWFAAFLVIGIVSGLVLQVPPWIFLSGAFVVGRGILLAWAVAQLDWSERAVVTAARVGTTVILFALATTLADLAMPNTWNAVLASDLNAVESRSILPSLIGPFTHPLDLGQFMALSAVAVAAWRLTVRKSAFTLGLLLATAAGALLTGRRTASAALAVAWLWLQRMLHSTRVLVALLAALPVAVLLLAGPVVEVAQATYQDYIGKGTPEARTVLTVDSFAVAAEHFPAGAGFGRFGSAVAAQNYSPEYLARGYPYIWGLGETADDGRFLTDTEWPAIIGETGYFGTIAYAAGLLAIYRAGRRLWHTAPRPVLRWAGLVLVGWLVAMVVESIGTVSFTGPPVYATFFSLVGVVAALSDTGQEIGEAAPPRGAPATGRDTINS
jgi:hypothetical protein